MAARSTAHAELRDAPAPPAADDPYERLRRVHDEAAEAARLANLVGRSLPAAILIGAFAGAALLVARAEAVHAVSFAILVSMGVGALLYAYAKCARAPFAASQLRAFAGDLDAVMLYLGFAWGAGAFLILPANADAAVAVLFSASVPALIGVTLRKREPVFMLAAPAALMTAAAAYIRPLAFPALTATMAILACMIVAGAVALTAWTKHQARFGAANSRAE